MIEIRGKIHSAPTSHAVVYPYDRTTVEKRTGDENPANICIVLTQLTASDSYSGEAAKSSRAAK